MVWTVFLVAVGFRLAALGLPPAERRPVNSMAAQITLAAAALGLAFGLLTPLPPAAAVIAAGAAGATTALALILVKGAAQRRSRRPPGRPSAARIGGRLTGAGMARATAASGALKDLITEFEREFGPWTAPPPPPADSPGSGESARPTPTTTPGGDDPYRVLGVTRSDDARTVRSRYLDLVKRDHPDHYSASPDQAARRARAEANLKIITEAYRLVRVERGWE